MTETFAEKLKKARNQAGLSMEELADLLNVSKQSVYKYEKNMLTPNPEALNKISKVLNVEIDALFRYRKNKLEDVSFRTGIEQAMIKLANVEDEVIEEMELLSELEKLSKNEEEFENPLQNLQITKMADVERAADTVRKQWKLGEEIPISNVVELLENKGIVVIQKFSNYSFEGFSAFYKERPVIVLNLKTDEITRRRFTALHELGHILLGKIISEKMKDRIEEICNVFAGILLLPVEVLKRFWLGRQKFVMQDFINLKESYGISILAIWISAIKLNLLAWETYNKWKEAYETQTNYGKFNGGEHSKRLETLVLKCILSGKISVEKAIEKTKKLNNNLDKTIILNMEYNMAI
jgi:Zn-dependent peptidase ImmA (M78 family)